MNIVTGSVDNIIRLVINEVVRETVAYEMVSDAHNRNSCNYVISEPKLQAILQAVKGDCKSHQVSTRDRNVNFSAVPETTTVPDFYS